MLIFNGQLPRLVLYTTPKFPTLFGKTANAPLFEDFEGPVEPPGCVLSKI